MCAIAPRMAPRKVLMLIQEWLNFAMAPFEGMVAWLNLADVALLVGTK